MINSDIYMTREKIGDMLKESERERLFLSAPLQEILSNYTFPKNSLLFRMVRFVVKSPRV